MWRSRTATRTIVSKIFTGLVSLTSGYRLKYYNGCRFIRQPS